MVGLISKFRLEFSARGEVRNARVRHQKRSAVYQARHMCWASPPPAPWGMEGEGCLLAPHLGGGVLARARRARATLSFLSSMHASACDHHILRLSFGKGRRWLALSGFSSKNGRDFHLKYGRVQVQFTINRYCRHLVLRHKRICTRR